VFIVGDVNVAFDFGANNPNDVPKSEPFNEIVGTLKLKHDIAFEDVEFKIACLLFNNPVNEELISKYEILEIVFCLLFNNPVNEELMSKYEILEIVFCLFDKVVPKSEPFKLIVGTVNDKHEIAFEDVEFNIPCLFDNVVPKSTEFKLIVGVAKDKHEIAFEDVEFKIPCLFDKVVCKLVPFKIIEGVIKEFVIVNADDETEA
jgi:hypothetical protein